MVLILAQRSFRSLRGIIIVRGVHFVVVVVVVVAFVIVVVVVVFFCR